MNETVPANVLGAGNGLSLPSSWPWHGFALVVVSSWISCCAVWGFAWTIPDRKLGCDHLVWRLRAELALIVMVECQFGTVPGNGDMHTMCSFAIWGWSSWDAVLLGSSSSRSTRKWMAVTVHLPWLFLTCNKELLPNFALSCTFCRRGAAKTDCASISWLLHYHPFPSQQRWHPLFCHHKD